MKTKIFSILVSAIFLLQGCDVTDRIPETSITDLTYWNKVEDLRAYTRYFYPTLSGPGYYDGLSDICVPAAPNATLHGNRIVPTGDDGWSYDDWANIRRCNYFMTHYQTVTGNATDINHYVGEARFFRAYEYFNKVKRFGDVPWFEKDLQTNDTELLNKGRDPRLFVIGKIIEDLKFGATNMKLPAQVSSGQLHRYAAYQMLARVCLFEATWQKYRGAAESVWKPLMQEAATAAKFIMDNGGYSIEPKKATYAMDNDHPLMYKGKFIQEDLTADKECILPRVYVDGLLMHNTARVYSEALSKDFIEQFLAIDGLPILVSPEYQGDDNIRTEVQNRDPRLWNIVNTPVMPAEIISGTPTWIPLGGSMPTSGTGYQGLKFRDPDPKQIGAGQATFDWYIFRYAETLLNYAEAKYELGECDQSVLDLTVNKLRARLDYTDAGGDPITMGRLTTTPVADPMATTITGQPRYGYAVAPLLYEIRRERCIELAFEGFRWDDIRRWKAGKLIENPKTMYGIVVNQDVIDYYTNLNSGTNPLDSRNTVNIDDYGTPKTLLRIYSEANESTRKWNEAYYLDPLPQNQTKLNPNLLPQNPGW